MTAADQTAPGTIPAASSGHSPHRRPRARPDHRRRRPLLAATLAVLAAGLGTTACAPVQAGAALVTNDQRVSTAQVEATADRISSDAQQIGAIQNGVLAGGDTPTQAAVNLYAAGLVWDRVATDEHVTVTPADTQAVATRLAEASGIDPSSLPADILASVGYPLDDTDAFYRVLAIEEHTLANHGVDPVELYSSQPSAQAQQTLVAARQKAVGELGLIVSPRYTGQQDYLAPLPGVLDGTVADQSGTAVS